MSSLLAGPPAAEERTRALDVSPTRPDPDSFSRVVREHLPRLHRLAARFLKSEDLAWDAVQETVSRLWLRGSLPEDPARVLDHLVARSCLHQLRCSRRRRVHEDRVATDRGACCEDDPQGGMELLERRAGLARALARLRDDYREVVVRCDLGGETYQAIADDLRLPIGTVRSRLSRARSQLREELLHEEYAA